VWCKGTGFFILGDSLLCEVPSRNTTCVICAGQVQFPDPEFLCHGGAFSKSNFAFTFKPFGIDTRPIPGFLVAGSCSL
jgi:hypothetical protein